MTYSTINLVHGKDGFSLYREEGRSHFKDLIVDITESLCGLTGHRYCHLLGRVAGWADKGTYRKPFVQIRDEDAYVLSAEDDWGWVRNPEA